MTKTLVNLDAFASSFVFSFPCLSTFTPLPLFTSLHLCLCPSVRMYVSAWGCVYAHTHTPIYVHTQTHTFFQTLKQSLEVL